MRARSSAHFAIPIGQAPVDPPDTAHGRFQNFFTKIDVATVRELRNRRQLIDFNGFSVRRQHFTR
jgi:hypothetical protein